VPFVAAYRGKAAAVKESPRAAAADFFEQFPDEPACHVYQGQVLYGFCFVFCNEMPIECTRNSLYLLEH
jgi:hypothetical protein